MIEELEHPDDENLAEAQRIAEEAEGGSRHIERGVGKWIIPVLAGLWSVFQLLLPSVILLDSTIIRSIHLTFAIVLVFLTHPMLKKSRKGKLGAYLGAKDRITTMDYTMAIIAGLAAFYIAFELLMSKFNPDYAGISTRQGRPILRDIVLGITITIFLLEAARRSLGPALAVVASIFILYSFFAQNMPAGLDFRNVSLTKFISKMTMSTEGIYGVPLDVSANIVFLFVLFGALLDKAGAGRYFVDLAFSLMGRFKGGPAKAAVLASGLTGMVSGSSIANTVTTGTFTIPLMKKVGYPDYKAGAVEVAVSTNGQLMPPIMGAAAFIIAETVNVPYIEVIRAAFIPAIISYIALLYIVHLEASKLGIKGLAKADLPRFWDTLIRGIHFMIPLVFLIVSLVVFRTSPALAAFRAILALAALIPLENLWKAHKGEGGLQAGWKPALKKAFIQIRDALITGGKNMMGIGVAVAAAGIIVGVVTFGLGGIITEAIEILSGGRFFLILIITAIASLILGMGLPTTATYIVMAALTAPVIVTLGLKSGVVFPLIAAHLFVFFFGILADDTPPVGLAAYAAAAIAKSDPIKTGLQGFSYDIRTAILPFIFMFNPDLLLHGVNSPLYAIWVFVTAMLAMFAFAALTQGWMRIRLKWWEYIALAGISFGLLMPGFIAQKLIDPFMSGSPLVDGRGTTVLVGFVVLVLYGLLYGQQILRGRNANPPGTVAA
jgi:TRAP transporter 4TM/12TM fusion protein